MIYQHMTIIPNETHKCKEMESNLRKNAAKKPQQKGDSPQWSHQFCYRENIPMAWGGT